MKKYLIQFYCPHDGWKTIGKSANFYTACKRAKKDYQENGRETCVILEGDPPILRRKVSENFKIE